MFSPIRVWDKINDRMLKQEDNKILAIKDNSYWYIEAGYDNVELIETQQNCAEIMYNTCTLDFKLKAIYEYDILRRDFYSFSDDFVFDQQYAVVFYKEGWRLKLENGSELYLTQVEEGRDFRVRSYVVGNIFEGYHSFGSSNDKKFWNQEPPSLLALNILSSKP